MQRRSGILLSISSLPSKYGIGCFDKAAYDFVDFLVKAGQKYWQILPLGSTCHGEPSDSQIARPPNPTTKIVFRSRE